MPIPNRDRDAKKDCYISKNNITDIDYKDVDLLNRFISSYGKILPRKRTGTHTSHQRKLSRAVKNARIMGLLPFVIE